MKNLLYTLTALMILLSSCKSIDKMIDEGKYDEALRYGADKLRGEKNKKTKYVKGLEKAYARLNKADRKDIEMLRATKRSRSFDQIVDIYKRMDSRQDYIMPLLPLISKDGYMAEFQIVNYAEIISSASQAAADYHYTLGEAELIKAKAGDKYAARRAYNHFADVNDYYEYYKDSRMLRTEAYEIGQTNILIEAYTQGNNMVYNHVEGILAGVDIRQLNSTWDKFYSNEVEGMTFDYVATIEVDHIEPGRERERYNQFVETKEVVNGQIPVIDTHGNVVKDTSGNIIYTDNKLLVSAQIHEMFREKIASINGKVIILDTRNNSLYRTLPISVTHRFEDYSCTYTGDQRALNKNTKNRMKSNCNPFPTDYEIVGELAYVYKNEAEKHLNKERFR